jgi:hypothetical protein
MNTFQFSSLARPLDPRYPTNRWILLIGFLVGAAGLAYQLWVGARFMAAFNWAFLAAAMVGLAWVLGRELDPDHEYAAFIGPLLALVGFLLLGPGSILVGGWLVAVLRTVNRTSGLANRVSDSLVVLALGLWLTYQGGWIYGAVTALAFIVDARLPQGKRWQWLFALLATLGTFGLVVLATASRPQGSSLLAGTVVPAWSLALGAVVLFLPVIAGSRQLTSLGDATGEPLQPRRVQVAQALALLGGLGVVLWSGAGGLVAWLPFWAAVLGAALYRAGSILRLV